MNYILSFREKPTGGAVVPGRLEISPNLGSLDSLRLEPNVTFLIHGFNVNYRNGRSKLLDFGLLLPAAKRGGIVGILWPGDHWIGPLSYSFEGRDADDSAQELAKHIRDNISTDTPISFVAHSLGSRVALKASTILQKHGYKISQVCLMAAAIDADSLAAPNGYFSTVSNATRVSVLSSKRDKVLRFAYPAGDLLQSFLFWNDSVGLALGYRGPKPHKRSPLPSNVFDYRIPNTRNADHGDYLPDIPSNSEQRSAANFANTTIAGLASPTY